MTRLLILPLLCACSVIEGIEFKPDGGGHSPLTIAGSVGGTPAAIADATLFHGWQNGTGNRHPDRVLATSYPALCRGLQNEETEVKDSQYLRIDVGVRDPDGDGGPATATGVYPIVLPDAGSDGGNAAAIWYFRSNVNCEKVFDPGWVAVSGSVTLTAVSGPPTGDGRALAGFFSATLQSGDTLTGNFDLGWCGAFTSNDDGLESISRTCR